MGHTHCAICGTVVARNTIAEHPRSIQFKLHRGERHETLIEREECIHCPKDPNEIDTELFGWADTTDYDPNVLKDEDIRWTERCQLLGFNVLAPRVSKAFLSGSGEPDNYGYVEVERGDHINCPERTAFFCYNVFDQDEKPNFPFHPLCYKLLQQVAKHKLRLDTLYEVFANLTVGQMCFSDISYGDPAPEVGQWWASRPGYEFMVANPYTEKPPSQLFDEVLSVIQAPNSLSVNVEQKVNRDPFSCLPNEVLTRIVSYLAIESTFAAIQASWPVKVSCDTEQFWKGQIKNRLPWFWELHKLTATETFNSLQAKQLLLWALHVTRPRLWLEGLFIHVTNRRRIWGVCEEIIDLCNTYENHHGYHLADELDRDVLEQAEVMQMPMVNHFANMKPIENITLIWIRTLRELQDGNPILETFWNGHGVLTGMSMRVAGKRQLFGIERHCRVETLQLDVTDWIEAIILHVRDPDRFEESTSAGVMGIDIISKSQKVSSLGFSPDTTSKLCQRPLFINPGSYLVGITGQLVGQQILHLGLVQCQLPLLTVPELSRASSDSSLFESQLPNAYKYAWFSALENELGDKLWNTSNLNVVEHFHEGTSFRSHCPDDLVPRHPLLFARTRADLATVTKIWAYVPPSHRLMFLGWPRTSQLVHRIAGISVEKNIDGVRTLIHAGYNADLDIKAEDRWLSESDSPNWEAKYMQSFEIDGAGGERITEVAATSPNGGVHCVRIRTNFDRETVLGPDDGRRQTNATAFRAIEVPADETIAGFSMGFGDVGGWSVWFNESMTVYRLASSMGVLTWRDW